MSTASDYSITLHPVDHTWLRVETDRGVEQELFSYFTFEVPGCRFHPAFKSKRWDGRIKLFQIGTGRLYRGLAKEVEKFAQDRGYTFTNRLHAPVEVKDESVDHFCRWLAPSRKGKPLPLRQWQIQAIRFFLGNRRAVVVSPTGSGKSLAIYSLVRLYEAIRNPEKKCLILVPNVQLVEQMAGDFAEYSEINKWDAEGKCHKIYSGKEKVSGKNIVISTWQSLYKNSAEYFQQFGMVIVDEVHTAKADSLKSIMEKCTAAKYRYGFTGTVEEAECHKLVLTGLFGEIVQYTTTRELMDSGDLASTTIDSIMLNYPRSVSRHTSNLSFQSEVEFLTKVPERNEFIVNLLGLFTDQNTIVMTNRIETHLMPLAKMIRDKYPDRPLYLIYGNVDPIEREKIRAMCEKQLGVIVLTTYPCFQQGVNITKIDNIVFAYPTKSFVRVMQSIGRGLRVGANKKKLRVYDIVDDLHTDYKTKNATYDFALAKMNFYAGAGIPFKQVNIRLNIGETTLERLKNMEFFADDTDNNKTSTFPQESA